MRGRITPVTAFLLSFRHSTSSPIYCALCGHVPCSCSCLHVLPRTACVPSLLMCLAHVQAFDEQPHLQMLKELFTQIFATPKRHHKSKPFFDHVISFSYADNRIWFRNYQVRAMRHEAPSDTMGRAELGTDVCGQASDTRQACSCGCLCAAVCVPVVLL